MAALWDGRCSGHDTYRQVGACRVGNSRGQAQVQAGTRASAGTSRGKTSTSASTGACRGTKQHRLQTQALAGGLRAQHNYRHRQEHNSSS